MPSTYAFYFDAAKTQPITSESPLDFSSLAPQDKQIYLGTVSPGVNGAQALSDPGVDDVLIYLVDVAFWTSGGYREAGDLVMSSGDNGHVYICIQSGAGGVVEPTWPTDGDVVLDGAAIWSDMGVRPPLTDYKLALSQAGLDAAIGGDDLFCGANIGTTLSFWVRYTPSTTDVGVFLLPSLQTNEIQDVP